VFPSVHLLRPTRQLANRRIDKVLGTGNTRVDADKVLLGTPIAPAHHYKLRSKMGPPESPSGISLAQPDTPRHRARRSQQCCHRSGQCTFRSLKLHSEVVPKPINAKISLFVGLRSRLFVRRSLSKQTERARRRAQQLSSRTPCLTNNHESLRSTTVPIW
jgi:hypothetical protein